MDDPVTYIFFSENILCHLCLEFRIDYEIRVASNENGNDQKLFFRLHDDIRGMESCTGLNRKGQSSTRLMIFY